jgi:hypothetical protein
MPQEPTPQGAVPSVPVPAPVPPELLAWAQQTFDAREFLEGVRDIEATGGEPLESFIAAVEAAARGS